MKIHAKIQFLEHKKISNKFLKVSVSAKNKIIYMVMYKLLIK